MTAAHARATLGIFPNHADSGGVANYDAFNTWIGRTLPYIQLNIAGETWTQFTGTSWGNYERLTDPPNWRTRPDVTICTTFGLNAGAGNLPPATIRTQLQANANGANDGKFELAARRMIAAGHGDAIIRLGHEQDITWYPWSALSGNWDVYIAAYRHVHDLLSALPGANFRFAYEGNGGPWDATRTVNGTPQPLAWLAYPGDAYVDIVAFNVYDRAPWSRVEELLDFALGFAWAMDKPFALSEWGLDSRSGGGLDNPQFIQNMFDWLSVLPASGPGALLYHGYHWANEFHKLDNYPNSKAKFLELFGGAIVEPPPPPVDPLAQRVADLEAQVTALLTLRANDLDLILGRLNDAGDALKGTDT